MISHILASSPLVEHSFASGACHTRRSPIKLTFWPKYNLLMFSLFYDIRVIRWYGKEDIISVECCCYQCWVSTVSLFCTVSDLKNGYYHTTESSFSPMHVIEYSSNKGIIASYVSMYSKGLLRALTPVLPLLSSYSFGWIVFYNDDHADHCLDYNISIS